MLKFQWQLCKKKSKIINHGFAYEDVLHHMDQKLKLPIQMVYTLAIECSLYQELISLLYDYVAANTAVNLNQLSYWYFKGRFIYCK